MGGCQSAHFITRQQRRANLEVGFCVEPQLLVLISDGDAVLLCQAAVLWDILDGDTIGADPASLSASDVLLASEFGEAPLVRSHDFLPSGELELGTTQSLNDMCSVGVLGTH